MQVILKLRQDTADGALESVLNDERATSAMIRQAIAQAESSSYTSACELGCAKWNTIVTQAIDKLIINHATGRAEVPHA